jgi:hypothetical protein
MGGSKWSDVAYTSVVNSKMDSFGTSFTHDKDVRSGDVPCAVHDSLDPKKIKNGIRESRDSDAHPESNAIIVALDVTGSMSSVIKQIHGKLPTLMGMLIRKNYISDPQIMFIGVGDATCDEVPLQVGQFESGVEMEGDISKLYLEGGGGGQDTESYELAAYVATKMTSIDCLEKRGKRGYFFFIGDECPYPRVKAHELRDVIGQGAEVDVPTDKFFKELQEKYCTFFILPESASNGQSKAIKHCWENLLGSEHVLLLREADAVSELIATQIGLCEGTADMNSVIKDLKESGCEALVPVVGAALSKGYAGSPAMVKVPEGAIEPSSSADVDRL